MLFVCIRSNSSPPAAACRKGLCECVAYWPLCAARTVCGSGHSQSLSRCRVVAVHVYGACVDPPPPPFHSSFTTAYNNVLPLARASRIPRSKYALRSIQQDSIRLLPYNYSPKASSTAPAAACGCIWSTVQEPSSFPSVYIIKSYDAAPGTEHRHTGELPRHHFMLLRP